MGERTKSKVVQRAGDELIVVAWSVAACPEVLSVILIRKHVVTTRVMSQLLQPKICNEDTDMALDKDTVC